MAFYELRQYEIRPGCMDAWLKLMEQEIIPGQVAVGMVIAGSFRGETDDSTYVWLRRFESEEQRVAQYAAFYESAHWKEVLSPQVGKLINRETLALLPAGAVLVNTARGALVDEDALLAALDSGHLSAAGLDCFQVEPGGNPAFAAHDSIFMLPHIGSATVRTRDAMGFRALDNLDAFFAGKPPRDRL